MKYKKIGTGKMASLYANGGSCCRTCKSVYTYQETKAAYLKQKEVRGFIGRYIRCPNCSSPLRTYPRNPKYRIKARTYMTFWKRLELEESSLAITEKSNIIRTSTVKLV